MICPFMQGRSNNPCEDCTLTTDSKRNGCVFFRMASSLESIEARMGNIMRAEEVLAGLSK